MKYEPTLTCISLLFRSWPWSKYRTFFQCLDHITWNSNTNVWIPDFLSGIQIMAWIIDCLACCHHLTIQAAKSFPEQEEHTARYPKPAQRRIVTNPSDSSTKPPTSRGISQEMLRLTTRIRRGPHKIHSQSRKTLETTNMDTTAPTTRSGRKSANYSISKKATAVMA